MTLTCPDCGNKKLVQQPVYYDLMVSADVEEYRYSCAMCRFVFYVKNKDHHSVLYEG